MSVESNIPRLGDIVYFYDENKFAFAAIVAFVHDRVHGKTDRPLVNLTIFKHDGRVRAQTEVEPAYDDGEKWRLIEKWSWPDEIPTDEFKGTPSPGTRCRQVGITDPIPA